MSQECQADMVSHVGFYDPLQCRLYRRSPSTGGGLPGDEVEVTVGSVVGQAAISAMRSYGMLTHGFAFVLVCCVCRKYS